MPRATAVLQNNFPAPRTILIRAERLAESRRQFAAGDRSLSPTYDVLLAIFRIPSAMRRRAPSPPRVSMISLGTHQVPRARSTEPPRIASSSLSRRTMSRLQRRTERFFCTPPASIRRMPRSTSGSCMRTTISSRRFYDGRGCFWNNDVLRGALLLTLASERTTLESYDESRRAQQKLRE